VFYPQKKITINIYWHIEVVHKWRRPYFSLAGCSTLASPGRGAWIMTVIVCARVRVRACVRACVRVSLTYLTPGIGDESALLPACRICHSRSQHPLPAVSCARHLHVRVPAHSYVMGPKVMPVHSVRHVVCSVALFHRKFGNVHGGDHGHAIEHGGVVRTTCSVTTPQDASASSPASKGTIMTSGLRACQRPDGESLLVHAEATITSSSSRAMPTSRVRSLVPSQVRERAWRRPWPYLRAWWCPQHVRSPHHGIQWRVCLRASVLSVHGQQCYNKDLSSFLQIFVFILCFFS
jgi:hypothetical protein